MYNKSKHLIGKIAAICAIVLGGMMLISQIYNIVLMVKYDNNFEKWYFLQLFFTMIIQMIVGGMLLAYGMSSLAKPSLYSSAEFGTFWIYAPRGKSIGLIVLGALRVFGGLLDMIIYLATPESSLNPYELERAFAYSIIQYASIVLGVAIILCKVISMNMKDAPIIAETQEELAEEGNA